jgi:hypothetical protein
MQETGEKRLTEFLVFLPSLPFLLPACGLHQQTAGAGGKVFDFILAWR